jgi:hypothetical protein
MIVPCRRIGDSPAFRDGILVVVVVVALFSTIVNDLETVKDEGEPEAHAGIGDIAAHLAPMHVPLEQSEGVRRRDPAR